MLLCHIGMASLALEGEKSQSLAWSTESGHVSPRVASFKGSDKQHCPQESLLSLHQALSESCM